jgi:dihydrofolate reductase
MPKLVASHSLKQLDAWNNSSLLGGDLVNEVTRRKQDQDLIAAGSDSVVQTLIQHDLIDEYRLLIFPAVVGEGRRLFRDGTAPINLRLVGAERRGEAVLTIYHRNTGAQ